MQSLPQSQKTYAEIKASKRMRWWYEHLADYMIAHPEAKQNDIASYFGRSASTISTIVNSDAFQAYLRQRRNNYVQVLETTVQSKMLQVADKGFDMILDRFDKKRDSIPLETLNRTVEMALKASGHGEQRGPAVVVNAPSQNTTIVPVPVSLADLQEAQQALRNAQNNVRPTTVIEGEFTEEPGPATADDIA